MSLVDASKNGIASDLGILEAKLGCLHLSVLEDGSGGKGHKPSEGSLIMQQDLRNALKNIGSCLEEGDLSEVVDLTKLHDLLRGVLNSCEDSERAVSNVLSFLKLLSELCTPLPQVSSTLDDTFWKKILEPISPDILEFLNQRVFFKCLNSLSQNNNHGGPVGESVGHHVTGSGSGFVFHQQLGTLLKGVRIILIYLKRAISAAQASISTSSKIDLSSKVTNMLKIFSALMDPTRNSFFKQENNFDVGLDIRCNIGVGICYSLYYLRNTERQVLRTLFGLVFSSSRSLEEKIVNQFSEVEREILKLVELDINRIALSFAVLNTWLNQEYDADLYFAIGRNILDIQHGVKEAVNLGSARVLETWISNLAKPVEVPSTVLHKVSRLFPSLELFCFMFMPGHIDAVKNCCRNIISSLAQVYDRLDSENFPVDGTTTEASWISSLLQTVLANPVHIKWLALSCVCRNTKRSLKLLEIQPDIPVRLLCADRVFKIAASDAYVALMSYHFESASEQIWVKTWVEPLFATQLAINSESNWPQKRSIISTVLNSEKLRQAEIQPMIIPLLKHVVWRMNVESHADDEMQQSSAEAVLLAAETIKLAHELKLTVAQKDLSLESEGSSSFRGLVPRSVLHQWLWSENPQIRLAGLALLVETKKTSEEVTADDFESLKIFFRYNLLSQNSAFRQQFVSYFKKLVRRLKDSLALIRRKKDTKLVSLYESFLQWLWHFLVEEEGLFYGANFGRRCQALECLSELTQVFTDFQIYGASPKGNLKFLRWLKDTYENNKTQALDILVRMPIEEFDDPVFCENLFKEAVNLCKSVKPPVSVTGRYLMTLLMRKRKRDEQYSPFRILEALYSELEKMFDTIKATSLLQVSSETPLYGCIRCVRMILQNTNDYKNPDKSIRYREYVNKLLKLCFAIDEILFPVLGNAAPEGFIPGLKDSNPDENKQVVRSLAAQMLLVCAWRTMKENCLLMSDMCTLFLMEGEALSQSPSISHHEDYCLLSYEQVCRIGDHLLDLLKNLMHRGVFEQVYVGFKQVANRLWRSPSRQLSHLPEKWLQDAMDQEHISAKSITRRSAGLPFIFQALLSSESDNEHFFQKWVQRLLIFDESPAMTPVRIHSMNVLRGLFRDANFSSAMMPFVPHGLKMAFRGLKSVDWTERNSGLILYGAVMRRSFGPKLNLMNAPTFFRKFPQMYDFLLAELDICINLMEKRKQEQKELKSRPTSNNDFQRSAEVTCDFTFHLLLLLSSFTSSGRVEDTHFKLSEFIPKIRKCGASDDMEVRKLAAKSLISFLTSPEEKRDLAGVVLKDLKVGRGTLTQNEFHGLLSQFLCIVGSLSPIGDSKASKDAINEIIDRFLQYLSKPGVLSDFRAPPLYETLMDTLVVLHKMNSVSSQKIYREGVETVLAQYEKLYSFQKNLVPGLSVTDRKVANAVIRIRASALSNEAFLETIYTHFTDVSNDRTRPYVEQFLELCVGDEDEMRDREIFQKYFVLQNLGSDSEATVVVVEAIIENYLKRVSAEFLKFPGTEFELKYLIFLGKLQTEMYQFLDMKLVNELIRRLFDICGENQEDGKELTTLQIKSNAFMILAKVTFATNLHVPQEAVTKVCDLAVEWSASGVDDDLREAVAVSFPQIPFPNLNYFSALNQAKLWTSVFLLAQDDEMYLRQIINAKIVQVHTRPCCDRKSLEVLSQTFFSNFLLSNPIEAFVILIGLLLREDFEVEARAADDETEDRLFDKSEMNMYFEHLTLAKVVFSEFLSFLQNNPSFKLNLNTVLSEAQLKLFMLVSNRNSVKVIRPDEFTIRRLFVEHNEDVPQVMEPNLGKVPSTVLHEISRSSDHESVRKLINGYLLEFSKLLEHCSS